MYLEDESSQLQVSDPGPGWKALLRVHNNGLGCALKHCYAAGVSDPVRRGCEDEEGEELWTSLYHGGGGSACWGRGCAAQGDLESPQAHRLLLGHFLRDESLHSERRPSDQLFYDSEVALPPEITPFK